MNSRVRIIALSGLVKGAQFTNVTPPGLSGSGTSPTIPGTASYSSNGQSVSKGRLLRKKNTEKFKREKYNSSGTGTSSMANLLSSLSDYKRKINRGMSYIPGAAIAGIGGLTSFGANLFSGNGLKNSWNTALDEFKDQFKEAPENIESGLESFSTGLARGIAAVPGILAASPVMMGSFLKNKLWDEKGWGDSFSNSMQTFNNISDTVNKYTGIDYINDALDTHQQNIMDKYRADNSIDPNHTSTLENFGLGSLGVAHGAGRLIGETWGIKAPKVLRHPKISARALAGGAKAFPGRVWGALRHPTRTVRAKMRPTDVLKAPAAAGLSVFSGMEPYNTNNEYYDYHNSLAPRRFSSDDINYDSTNIIPEPFINVSPYQRDYTWN